MATLISLCLTALGTPLSAQIYIEAVSYHYHSPYLLDFTFSLRQQTASGIHALVVPPSSLGVVCKENDVAISPSETGYRVLPGDNKKLKSYLVLDYTLSMADLANGDANTNYVSDAIETMERSAKTLIGTLSADAQLGIYEFHREDRAPNKVCDPVSSRSYLSNRIDRIRPDYVQGWFAATRCWDAVYAAVTQFSGANTEDERRYVVFLSDGRDESSTRTPQEIIGAASSLGVTIYAVGFGRELVGATLQEICIQTQGQYYPAANLTQLADAFTQIGNDLKGQYMLRWATLKRSGTAFTPSFEITYQTRKATYVAPPFRPTDHAGDVLAGQLEVAVDPETPDQARLILSADYVPRYVTRLRFQYDAPTAPSIEIVALADGGVCPPGWVVEHNLGERWFELRSQDPQNTLTALPYATRGKSLRLAFGALTEPSHALYSLAIDNSLYSVGGQSFSIVGTAAVTCIKPTITFNALADRFIGQSPFTVYASASGGLPVLFSIVSGPATISGNQVTLIGGGTVTIRAAVVGNDTYGPAHIDRSFNVQAKQVQTITFAPLVDRYVDEVFSLNAIATSGLAVQYGVVSGPAVVTGSQLRVTGAGQITLRASQPGDGQYEAAAPVERSFNALAKVAQTVTFPPLSDRVVGETFTLAASANSGLPLTYRVVSGGATIQGNTVACNTAGPVTVRAEQAGNAQYQPAWSDRSFAVLTELPHRTPVNWLSSFGWDGTMLELEAADPDGDGAPNWHEYAAGTNPTNSGSAFVATAPFLKEGRWQIGFRTAAYWVYRLEYSADLRTWNTLQDGIAGTGQTFLWADPTNRAACYYRVTASVAAPVITSGPLSQGVNEGQQVNFAVAAVGGNLKYQWRFNGADIAGANNSAFLIQSATLAHLGSYDVVVSNAGGVVTSTQATIQLALPNMVWCPPGTFTMGSPTTEVGRRSNEGPQTRVTLTKGFYMGRYEVTQREYLAVVGSNPSYYTDNLDGPVEYVLWLDATNYCRLVTQQERAAGRLPSRWEYRLPTEAQWEYACRAGRTTPFGIGNGISLSSTQANFVGYAPYGGAVEGPSLGRTTTVGSYAPNTWGLYDMHGNVSEWCLDWYGESLPGGSVSDPVGPSSGWYRVIRGGFFSDGLGAGNCRSAFRSTAGSTRHEYHGFRVVLVQVQ